MASLVLLLSELLRHENPDYLISLPAATTASAAMGATTANNGSAASSASKRDVIRKSSRCLNNNDYKSMNKGEFFKDDLPRVSVELVWP